MIGRVLCGGGKKIEGRDESGNQPSMVLGKDKTKKIQRYTYIQ